MPRSAEGSGWGGSRPGAGRPPASAATPLPLAEGLRWYVVSLYGPWRPIVTAIAEGDSRAGHMIRPAFDAYSPTTRIMRRRVIAGRKTQVPVEAQMIPGYAFVRFDAAHPSWGHLSNIDGVVTVLRGASGRPLPVPDRDMDRLRKMSKRLLALDPTAMTARDKGAQVTVIEGPFTGQAGTVVHCDGFVTAVYGITVFGRTLTMQFPWGDLRGDADDRKPEE